MLTSSTCGSSPSARVARPELGTQPSFYQWHRQWEGSYPEFRITGTLINRAPDVMFSPAACVPESAVTESSPQGLKNPTAKVIPRDFLTLETIRKFSTGSPNFTVGNS